MQVNTTAAPLNIDDSRKLPKIGEYKKIEIWQDDEAVSKDFYCYAIREYDSQEHQIYEKTSSYQVWNKYDSNGNLIHKKEIDGRHTNEEWYEYRTNGKYLFRTKKTMGLDNGGRADAL